MWGVGMACGLRDKCVRYGCGRLRCVSAGEWVVE